MIIIVALTNDNTDINHGLVTKYAIKLTKTKALSPSWLTVLGRNNDTCMIRSRILGRIATLFWRGNVGRGRGMTTELVNVIWDDDDDDVKHVYVCENINQPPQIDDATRRVHLQCMDEH